MSAPSIIIEANKTSGRYWADIWRYRDLLVFLAWRDIRVRYRQAVLGAGWAIIQPLLQTIMLTFVFSRMVGLKSGDTPYPLMVMVGLLPWQFFTSAFNGASSSVASNSHLVTKVYFPRLVIPLSSLAVAAVDLAILMVIALPLCFWFGPGPKISLLCIPFFVLHVALLALGAGLWACALSVRHRDLRFLLPFLLQLGLFITPVGYRSDINAEWQHLMSLNPLTAAVDGFRWSLLGGEFSLDWYSLTCSLSITSVVVLGGLWLFRRSEAYLADTL